MRVAGRSAALRRLGVMALPLAILPLLAAADAPTGGNPGTRAFVITNIFFVGGADAGTCSPMSVSALETFRESLSPEEQARYPQPQKRNELSRLMDERLGFRRMLLSGTDAGGRLRIAQFPPDIPRGTQLTPDQALRVAALNGFPKGRGRLAFSNRTIAYSACSNPEDFPQLARGHRLYEGRTAEGMDLDGKRDRSDFVGPAGQTGIDNQLWRAIGCTKAFRDASASAERERTFLSARAPTLIRIEGIDDPRNDPDVTVTISAAADPIVQDGRNQAVEWASYADDADRRLTATTHGRIVDGVLTTDPVDVRLNYKEQILDSPRDLRAARLRLELKPDGKAEGGFYGYYTLDSFYLSIEQMTQDGANASGVSCPGVRQAIDRLADGYRDSRTGKYTAISSALRFYATPAFTTGVAARADAAGQAGGGR